VTGDDVRYTVPLEVMAPPPSFSMVAPRIAEVSVIPLTVGVLNVGGVMALLSIASNRKITMHQKDTRDFRVKSKAGKIGSPAGTWFWGTYIGRRSFHWWYLQIQSDLPDDTGKAGFRKTKCVPDRLEQAKGVRDRVYLGRNAGER
jgi:hypothetical protein